MHVSGAVILSLIAVLVLGAVRASLLRLLFDLAGAAAVVGEQQEPRRVLRLRSDAPKNLKLYKISHHIESCVTYMEH
jgi:hypothetical protein